MIGSTEIIVGAVAYASKDVVAKVLGPTADYLGQGLRANVEAANRNISAILSKAYEKLGERVDERGEVNPRVVKEIFSEGAFTEAPIIQEYYAGLLVSARTEDGKDDRAVRYSKILSALTVNQVRAHFVVYTTYAQHLNQMNLGNPKFRNMFSVGLPFSGAAELFGAKSVDREQLYPLIEEALFGLHADRLIDSFFYGTVDELREFGFAFDDRAVAEMANGCLMMGPHVEGLNLFLWAMGFGDIAQRDWELVNSASRKVEELRRLPRGQVLQKAEAGQA